MPICQGVTLVPHLTGFLSCHHQEGRTSLLHVNSSFGLVHTLSVCVSQHLNSIMQNDLHSLGCQGSPFSMPLQYHLPCCLVVICLHVSPLLPPPITIAELHWNREVVFSSLYTQCLIQCCYCKFHKIRVAGLVTRKCAQHIGTCLLLVN